MSFILDALARQGASPVHATTKPANRARTLRRLAVSGTALVLVACLGGAGLYAARAKRAAAVRATAASAPSPERTQVAAIDVPTMAPRALGRASEPATRAAGPASSARPASAAGTNRAAALASILPRFSPPTTLSQVLPVPSPLGPGGAFVAPRTVAAPAVQGRPPDAPRAVAITDLKPLSVLAPDMRAMLARMKVRVLFYTPQPRSRFVMIDGRELREGDELFTGLRLQEITDTGMVLRHKDLLVLSPAPEGR